MEPGLAAGMDAFNRGDFAAAARLFRRESRRRGAGPEAALFLAQSLRSLGKLAAATACLKKLAAARPDYAPAYRGLAETLQARGLLEEAVRFAREAARRAPDDARTRALDEGVRRDLSWRWRKRALALQQARRWRAAESWLGRALELAVEKEDVRGELERLRAERAERARAAEERARARRELAVAKARAAERRRRRKERGAVDRAARKAFALLLEGRKKDAALWAGRSLALDRARLKDEPDPVERLRSLIRLGRYDEACALGESFLDAGPTLEQTRAFWNPWGWLPKELLPPRHGAALEALLARGRFAALATYLRAALRDRAEPAELDALAALPPGRYGWMRPWLSQRLLVAGRWDDAARAARSALDYRPLDWPARFRLAEALICAGRQDEALEQSALGARDAPREERAGALAWKGELDLWLGRYEEAFEELGEACAGGAALAWCWRGAAALRLGRLDEGLALLDEALRREPNDLEVRVWRGEGRRLRGDLDGSLRELARAPAGVWSSVNRALAFARLGDARGLRAEFARVPSRVVSFVGGRLGLDAVESEADMTRVLENAPELARGFRREDYEQRVWVR